MCDIDWPPYSSAPGVLKPVTIPVGLVLLVHAWVIPELYAARGAAVVRAGRGQDNDLPVRSQKAGSMAVTARWAGRGLVPRHPWTINAPGARAESCACLGR